MAPKKDRETRQQYEDYGIDLNNSDLCPRCEQPTLKVNREAESWHCENRNCQWIGKLKSTKSQIMDAEEAAPAIMRWHTVGPPEGMSYGYPHLDEYVKALRGEWTLITGHAGQGKTHFVDAMVVNMAAKGWKFAMYAQESLPYERHVKALAQKFLGKRFSECDADEIRLAVAWLKERIFFVEPAEPTLESVLAQFWKLIKTKKIQGVIIDPWNEVEHAIPMGMQETQYTSQALRKFRKLCEAGHVHGWIVAHPAKMQIQRKGGDEKEKRPVVRLADVAGSANFENKPFFGISIWRNPVDEENKHVNHIYILKARNEDMGRVGHMTLNWDPRSTGYYQINEVGMGESVGDQVKAKLDKMGGWRKLYAVKKGREEDALKQRAAQWEKDKDNPDCFTFQDSEGIARVQAVRGPSETVWEASVTRKNGKALDQEFAIKEDALDWAEQQLFKTEEA